MKDAYFAHVARVEANRYILADVGCQGKRQVAQTLKVNAVSSYLTCTNFLHEQKIELLKRFRHTRQESTVFPTLGGCKPIFRACAF